MGKRFIRISIEKCEQGPVLLLIGKDVGLRVSGPKYAGTNVFKPVCAFDRIDVDDLIEQLNVLCWEEKEVLSNEK